jgi:hypothetical protein
MLCVASDFGEMSTPLDVPKQDGCHQRPSLSCGFGAARHGSCHQVGVLLVTSSTESTAVVTRSGAPSAT